MSEQQLGQQAFQVGERVEARGVQLPYWPSEWRVKPAAPEEDDDEEGGDDDGEAAGLVETDDDRRAR